MSAMGEMPIPGRRTMSMAWMPGQTWPGAVASFLGMWVLMMVPIGNRVGQTHEIGFSKGGQPRIVQ